MYGNQNCINPIIQFVDVAGFLIWGQKTLQRLPSALDRVNVRRMMFYAERQISTACRTLIFEPNDALFVTKFESLVKNVLDTIQTGQGLSAYIINDGPDLNTPDVIASNEFRAQIGIQPILAVEFIFLEFSVQAQGNLTAADLRNLLKEKLWPISGFSFCFIYRNVQEKIPVDTKHNKCRLRLG